MAQSAADTLRVLAGDTIHLTHSNLIPFSETVEVLSSQGAVALSEEAYELEPFAGWLVVRSLPSQFGADSVRIRVAYRHFPTPAPSRVALREPQVRRDSLTLEDYYYLVPPDVYEDNTTPAEAYGSNTLNSSGSLSRAITVGTNRDLGVNSDFRLQLDGQLGDGLEVTAAITDQNIPIQPSGTTQQLQDFDRVFIQLRKLRHQLTFGDFEVQNTGTRFANVYRNVLGAQYRYVGTDFTGGTSFTVSKGRFHTQSFQGENGKQGPYRLQGRQGENFIIILAGSEKVYLNGRLMQRGEDRDYIIEYNTGELTFTANQPVTVNARIVVDFEYSDRNYSRSLWFSQGAANLGTDNRVRIRASYGREADNPNAPLDLELGDAERLALREAGDDPSLAVTSGIDTVGWDPALVLYRATDSTVAGQTYSPVFVYSSDSTVAQFRLVFANLGPGNGDYIRDLTRVNGNVFRWVAPDSITGRRMGEYAPVKVLPLPRKITVLSVGAEVDITEYLTLSTENATSSEDRNRLSRLDDDDNRDYASYTRLELKPVKLVGGLRLGAFGSFQYVGAAYQNFDRVYEREYGRQWNFNDLGTRATERLYEAGIRLRLGDKYSLNVTGGYRLMGDSLETYRQGAEYLSTDSVGLMGRNEFSRIETRDSRLGRTSVWLRNEGDLSRVFFKTIQLGAEIWVEDRQDRVTDNLVAGSFRFADLKPYLRLVNRERVQAEIWYRYRADEEYVGTGLRPKSLSQQPGLRASWNPFSQLRLQNTTNYQRFTVRDTAFESQGLASQNVLISNSQVSFNTKNGMLTTNTLYEITTEQIARRQEVYVEVAPGMGQFEWVDYNENQVQELDEFRIAANPLIANFVKILSPTAELFPATGIRSGFNLQLDFKRGFPTRGIGFTELMRNISLVTSARLDQRRETQPGQAQRFYPLLGDAADRDSALLNNLVNLRQDLFFFRNSPKGDVSFSVQEQFSRLFLSSGSETRQARTWITKQRLNIGTKRSIENQIQLGVKRLSADVLLSRNFHVDFLKVMPSHSWQVSRRFRFSAGYEFQWKQNREESGFTNSRLSNHKIFGDFRVNFGSRNSLFAKIEMFRIRQLGEANPNATFELLEGNQNGLNVTGNLLFTYYLTRFLELSVAYDARFSRVYAPIHSARMQLRAIF